MERGASPRARARRRWLAAPAGVLFTGAFLCPLLTIVAYSVGESQPFGSATPVSFARVSLDNFVRAVDPTFVALLGRTFAITAAGTLACLLLGLPVAYTLATRVSDARKPLVLLCFVVPYWTSFLLRTFAWRVVLSANGPLASSLAAVGVLDGPLAVLDTSSAVLFGVVYNYLPLMILPLFVAFDRVDPRLRDASRDLGAGSWATFRLVSWPLAMPGIAAGCLLVFIPLAGEYVTPAILGGVRGMMAGSLIASQFLEARDWALGAAQAVLLVAAILTVAGAPSAIGRVLRTRRPASVGAQGAMSSHGGGTSHRGGRRASRALWAWTAIVGVLLYLPLILMAVFSFNDNRFLLRWSGFGLDGYREALANVAVWGAFQTSLLVAAASAVVAVTLGGLAGVAMAHDSGRWRGAFGALIGFVLVAPEIVVGIASLMAFVAVGVDSGTWRLLLSHSVFSTALVTMVVRARAEGLSPALEDAAADLGASPGRVFWDVTLPLLRPALLAGGCLAFTFSLDDVVLSAFVGTAGSVTLPVYIFSALRTGVKTEHAAAAVVMLAVTVTLLAATWRLAGRDLFGTWRRGEAD